MTVRKRRVRCGRGTTPRVSRPLVCWIPREWKLWIVVEKRGTIETCKKPVMMIRTMANIKVEISFEVILERAIFPILPVLFSACVSHVDPHKEDLQLTIEQSSSRTSLSLSILSKGRDTLFSCLERYPSTKKLVGSLLRFDWLDRKCDCSLSRVWSIKMICRHISRSWPICDLIVVMNSLSSFSLLRRQEEEPLSYEDILQTSKSFSNRACVQTLYQRLKQSFQQIQPDQQQHSESSATPSNTNDILHMTLINAFKR